MILDFSSGSSNIRFIIIAEKLRELLEDKIVIVLDFRFLKKELKKRKSFVLIPGSIEFPLRPFTVADIL